MHIVYNSNGFWDDERGRDKAPGVKRVLFLGDSFTMGYAVQREERYTDLVAGMLPEGVEVINLGMWGYSADQQYLVLERIGIGFNPDVIVLAVFLNDFFETNLYAVGNGYLKPKFKANRDLDIEPENLPLPDNHGESHLWNQVVTRYYLMRNRIFLGAGFLRAGWIGALVDTSYADKGYYALCLALIDKMREVAAARGAEFHLVYIPYRSFVIQEPASTLGKLTRDLTVAPEHVDLFLPQKMLLGYCRAAEVSFLDLTPVFDEYKNKASLFFRNDLHWNSAGHRVAAAAIYDFLATNSKTLRSVLDHRAGK
ncbi:MAG: hypothetical protein AB1634_17680 [Thermodesulfobacteriota bacterium]